MAMDNNIQWLSPGQNQRLHDTSVTLFFHNKSAWLSSSILNKQCSYLLSTEISNITQTKENLQLN